MTALEEILEAEQTAEQQIAAAEDEAVTAVAVARSAQREKITAEEVTLAKATEAAMAEEQVRVEGLAKVIADNVQEEVASIKQRFDGKREQLLATIKKRFQ